MLFITPSANDTVAADKESDEVETDENSWKLYSSIRPNRRIHHHIPIFARQYLYTTQQRRVHSTSKEMQQATDIQC